MSKSDELILRVANARPLPPAISEFDLMAIEAEVGELISTIASQPDVHRAEPALLRLGDIQELLATLAFKYRVSLPERLSLLVREFDRSDDFGERLDVYERCKTGEFLSVH